MRKSISIGMCLLGATLTSYGQNDINKIIPKTYVDHLIKTISSDEMQGRRTFTPGIEKAAVFIEQEFKSIGLKPLQGAADYRQTFYKYQLTPSSIKVEIDGEQIPESRILVVGSAAETLSFDQSTADGWIKMDPEKDFMTQYRSLMRSGKRQLVLVDKKFEEMFHRFKANSSSRIVDEKDLKDSKPAAVVLVLGKESVLSGFTVSLRNEVKKLPLSNVVGVIPGKTKAKELVIFSAHYDHMGIVKPKEGDSIMNGADDDASGTTAVIALAKYYKKLNNNERTLIFVAFTGEEMGMFGSRYFSQQLNPDEVVAMFNIEMIGKESKFGKNAAFITGYDKSDLGEILQKNLKGTVFTFHPDPYIAQNLFYRSDNATLAALGVPAHTISTDQIDTDIHYHQVSDEYETLDVDNIWSTIKAIAKSAESIVKGTDTPKRIPKLN